MFLRHSPWISSYLTRKRALYHDMNRCAWVAAVICPGHAHIFLHHNVPQPLLCCHSRSAARSQNARAPTANHLNL